MSSGKPVPVSEPDLGELEERFVLDAVRSSWIGSVGSYLDTFRSEFSALTGSAYVVPVSNGTVAIHLALRALGVGPGDEVIVPALTYIAPVNAVTYCGASPVFADVERDSWGIDPSSVERLISDRTVAIVAVHLYGMPASMDKLRAIASNSGLYLIEDAAEAPFARFAGQPVGSLGDVATFSFFGNKIITSGEGGAVTTNSAELFDRLELLRGQGMDPNRRYWFKEVGFNYRLTNVAAALLCAQLSRHQEILERRWRVFEAYDTLLGGNRDLEIQADIRDRDRVPWLYPLLVLAGEHKRNQLMSALESHRIETRPFFPPVQIQPPYAESRRIDPDGLRTSQWLADRGLNLPTFPHLARDEIERICRVIEAHL